MGSISYYSATPSCSLLGLLRSSVAFSLLLLLLLLSPRPPSSSSSGVVRALSPECRAIRNKNEGNDPHPLEPKPRDWKHFKGWTCDEMVPDLCELSPPEQGSFVIKGFTIKYWRYKPPPGKAEEMLDRRKQERRREKAKNAEYSTGEEEEDDDDVVPDMYPMIVVHGGPSQSHDYMLNLKQQACRGREVIFYDQAGCGRSSWPNMAEDDSIEKHFPWLLDIHYYTTELKMLIDELKDVDKYHLWGHSWGSIVMQLYALDQNPGDRLISMVWSGPFSDWQVYNDAQWCPETGTMRVLPPYVRKRFRELEENDDHDAEEYQALDGMFSVMFTSLTVGTHIVPDCVRRTYDDTNWVLYDKIWGPSEVRIVPDTVLYGFSTNHRMKDIDYPVLLTNAEYDLMTIKVLQPMIDNLPYNEHVFFRGSAHATVVDAPGPLNDATADFYERVEKFGKDGVKRRRSIKM